jgi:glucosylceramidase
MTRCRFKRQRRTGVTFIWLFVVFAVHTAFGEGPIVHWKCSTPDQLWIDQPDLKMQSADSPSVATLISIDATQHLQTIDGWGGCFNERGWQAMRALTDDQRTKVMRMMFDPNDGLKLNICRTPIGASDYGIDLYSYDETPGDFPMEHFSIDRDKKLLIPYIKAALAIQPDLKLWAVPWSPPSWMKDTGVLAGGHIKTDPATMNALALYFAKYIQAYRAEGLPLYMVMSQNEPCYSTGYTSCEWTGAEIAMFVGDYLGPLLKKMNIDCQIYLGTFPRSDEKKYDYNYWLAPSLSDPVTRSFVTGVGCQWGGSFVMQSAHDQNPSLKLMQTEAECGDTNTNDWAFACSRFGQIVKYLDAGAESFMIWNLVLDETGLSTANWAQCSPIVVDQVSGEVTYTPYFYAFRHYSSFVRPGAVRVKTPEGAPCDAFVNTDGSTVVVLENPTPAVVPIVLRFGDRNFTASVPAHSFNTFVLAPAK